MTGWIALLGTFRAVFTAPSFAIFTDLLTGGSAPRDGAPSPP